VHDGFPLTPGNCRWVPLAMTLRDASQSSTNLANAVANLEKIRPELGRAEDFSNTPPASVN
jgi:hypothetical protein